MRSQTPIVALLVFGVIDLGVMFYGYKQPSSFGTLVGATAIIPYIIYFLITVAYAVKRRTTDSLPGAFNLGRWAWPVIIFVLAYTVLIMIVLSLPSPFHGADKVLGYGLIAGRAVVLRRPAVAAEEGHRRGQAGRGPGRGAAAAPIGAGAAPIKPGPRRARPPRSFRAISARPAGCGAA